VEKLKQFAFDICTVGQDEGHSKTVSVRSIKQNCFYAYLKLQLLSINCWCFDN